AEKALHDTAHADLDQTIYSLLRHDHSGILRLLLHPFDVGHRESLIALKKGLDGVILPSEQDFTLIECGRTHAAHKSHEVRVDSSSFGFRLSRTCAHHRKHSFR